MKKALSVVLSICMLLSTIAGLDFSAYAVAASGNCGENVTYSFDNNTKTLTISGSGNMYDYSEDRSDNPSPFYEDTGIKSVVIEDGVTGIGDYAFYCSGISSVSIADSVTSLGAGAFSGCVSLNSIKLPNGITEIKSFTFDNSNIQEIKLPANLLSIDSYAFYCTPLKSIRIPSSVTSIGEDVFRGCSDLTTAAFIGTQDEWNSISIGEGNTNLTNNVKIYTTSAQGACGENLTYSYSFANNKGVLTISGTGDMANYTDESASPFSELFVDEVIIEDGVTSIGDYAFYCIDISSVSIADSVTSVGQGAFSGCVSLNSIELPNGITEIKSYTFDNSEIKEIKLPANLLSIGSYAFYCTPLQKIVFPSSLTSIGESAFSGCSSLAKVLFGGTPEQWNSVIIGSNNSNITSNIMLCPESAQGSCGDDLTYSYTYADNKGVLTISGTGAMTDYTSDSPSPYSKLSIDEVIIEDSVTGIGNYAFYGCSSLTSIAIPDGVTSIGTYAFCGCSGLKELTMPCSAKIYNSQYTFGGCTNIEKVTLTKGTGTMQDYSSSTGYSNTYYQYTPWYYSRNSIKELVIEDGVEYIGSYAFYKYSSLESITIPDSVTNIGNYAFYGCSGLKELTMPCSARINNLQYTFTFYNCTNIEKVTLTKGTGTMQTYGTSTTSSTTTYYQYTPWYISRNSFKELVIENGVTSIGAYAFNGCSNIKSVTIPASVNNIGAYAFNGCSALTNVKFLGSYEDWSKVSVGSCNTIITSYVKFCPESAQGTCGENLTYSYTYSDNKGVLTISGTGAMTEYTSASSSPFGKHIINEAIVEEGVTSIGNYAFYGCSSLTSISLSDSVTSIGNYAFYGCSSLTSIAIPDSATSIGDYAFNYCSGLKEFSMPCSAKIYNSQYTFGECTNIEKVTLTKGTGTMQDYSSTNQYTPWYISRSSLKELVIEDGVESIGSYAFYFCSGLKSVTISDSVTSIGTFAFYGCSSLTRVNINSVEKWCSVSFGNITANPLYYAQNLYVNDELVTDLVIPTGVTSIGDWAFSGCSGLTSISLSDSITSIGSYAFNGCSGLTSISLSDSITSIGSSAFGNCSSLTSIAIPDGVTSLGTYAFNGCSSLTSITIPDGVTSIGIYTFNGCSGLTSIYIPESVTSLGEGFISDCNSLESIVVDENNPVYDSRDNCNAIIETESNTLVIGCKNAAIPSSVTSIGDSAFYGCSGLTSITIPDGVTSIGDSAFYGCRDLTNVNIPDSVTSIGDCAFYGCSGLTSITLADSVTSIGDFAFYGCSGLKTVIYYGTPEQLNSISLGSDNYWLFDANWVYCPESAQGTCGENLTYSYSYANGKGVLTISGTGAMTDYTSDTPSPYSKLSVEEVIIENGVTSIGNYAFYKFTGLTSITIPNSITSIGKWAFGNCSGLKSIALPDGLTSIGDAAFSSCSGLTSIDFPDSLKSIGESAFQLCNGFTSIEIPNSMTSISNFAFSACENLTSITIPNSVKSIGSFTFQNCTGLESITMPDSVTSIGSAAFTGCSGIKELTMPCSAKIESSFKNCTNIEKVTLTKGTGTMQSYNSSTYQYTPWYISRNSIKELVIEDGVESIGSYAFYGCSGIKELTMPCSAKINNSQYTFGGCTNIEKVTLTKGTGTMQDYSSSTGYSNTYYEYTPWNISQNSIKEFVIEDGVESIGSYAFYFCSGLTYVDIPDSVTSIGSYAFYYCSGLLAVNIPDSVTSIGNYAFYECRLLLGVFINSIEKWCSISFGNDYANPLYYAHKLYVNYELVTDLEIPAGVTSIRSYAFCGCRDLTSIEIPDSVTSIGDWVFSGCSSLTSIEIPDSVTSLGSYAFNGCSGLTSITIPDGVTTIGDGTFCCCSSLESIKIPDGVTYIGYRLFEGCSGLNSVTIGNSAASISNYAFNNCSGLKELTMPCSAKINNSQYTFSGCTNIEKVTLSKGTGTMQAYANSTSSSYTYYQYTPWYISRNSIKELVIEDGVESIGAYAFYGWSGVKELTMPCSATIDYSSFNGCSKIEKVTLTKGTGMMQNSSLYSYTPWYLSRNSFKELILEDGIESICSNAFNNCTELTSLTIPKSVTSISESAFNNCSSLESIVVDENNAVYDSRNDCNAIIETESNILIAGCKNTVIPDNVTSIGAYAFSNRSGLTNVTIPDGVTKIGDNAFYYCSGIKELTMPCSAEIGQRAFMGCTGIEKVTLTKGTGIMQDYSEQWYDMDIYYNCPWYASRNDVEEVILQDGIEHIGTYAFYECSGLTIINIPESVKSIGNSAFRYCSSLESINIPKGVTNIDEYSFMECRSLKSITIPEGVRAIDFDAFYQCTSLTSVSLPKSLKYIEQYAFGDCPITDVYYSGAEDDWSRIYFGSNNKSLILADIHYSPCEHDWVLVSRTEATCIASGKANYECAICGEQKSDIAPLLEHTFVEEKHDATPNSQGYTKYTCPVCGYAYVADITPYASDAGALESAITEAHYYSKSKFSADQIQLIIDEAESHRELAQTNAPQAEYDYAVGEILTVIYSVDELAAYQAVSIDDDNVVSLENENGDEATVSFEDSINEYNAPLDLNGDGIVNAKDYALLLKNYS